MTEVAMKVIVLASSKGGCTKSTTAAELAVAAEINGDGPVALIDLDPQHTTTDWCEARQADTPVIAKLSMKHIDQELNHIREHGIKTLIIDTPGYTASQVPEILSRADLVIVPVRASPDDMRTIGRTLGPILSVSAPFIFLIVGATPRARITDACGRELAQHGIVAPITIHHRLSVPAARIDGRSVIEVEPEGKAADEFRGLWKWVSGRINKQEKVAA